MRQIHIRQWKKAWISQHKMLLMLSLLILSAIFSYGLARNRISWKVIGTELKPDWLEIGFGILGFLLLYSIMKMFLRQAKSLRMDENAAKETNEESFVQFRLGEMAASFRKLAHMMGQEAWNRTELSEDEKAEAFSEITERMCADCGRREYCWEKEYYDTSHSAYELLSVCSEHGQVEKNQVPAGFRHRCIHMDQFLRETNRVIQTASSQMIWKNRFHENRLAMAGQVGEIAEIIDDLSLELTERHGDEKKLSERLNEQLIRYPIRVKKLSVSNEGRMGRRQKIYIMAKMRRGKSISVYRLAEWISDTAGQRFVPEKGTPETVGHNYEVFELIEDTRYRIVHGIARKTKTGENVSGDSYAFIYLDSGQVLMSLSDGMGSGEEAKKDSEFMISLLEQMADTGFGRRSSLRMLNSMMMFREDKQFFSSMDLSVIDLYSGICELIKVGASSTFIKRDRKVDCITSGSLPMGVFPEIDCENVSRNLFDGDVIVMMTDGVVNRFPHGNESVCELLSQMDMANPNVMAAEILNEALDCPSQVQEDDMTVLVCTVCKKSTSVL